METETTNQLELQDSIDKWQLKSGQIQHASTLLNLFGNTVVLIASLIALYIVTIKRK